MLGFAGSFVVLAVGWTALLQAWFGVIRGAELTTSWVVAVFGSWFLVVIPFMRKKEQIWKRLNEDQEKAVNISFLGSALFIGFLIASTLFWDFRLRDRLEGNGFDGVWVRAVFGTWIVVLMPFLVFLYKKAEVLFKAAHERQTYKPTYRQVAVDRSERILPDAVAAKIKASKETLPHAHLVSLILKDGRVISDVFVRHTNEIAGLYNRSGYDFKASEVADVKVADKNSLPVYQEINWLRLDIE